jgi:Gpi18-like mannosyltransferase
MKALKQIHYVDALAVAIGVALAVALRYSLLEFKSVDFQQYTRVWYNTLREGGFSAFSQDFSNYNVPYLYLLYLVIRFLPGLPSVIATKVPSLIADFVVAWLAYRIVRLQYRGSPIAMFAAFAVLFAPTIALNSAFWGQADALYTSALVACVYFLLIRQDLGAMLMFGISLAFKAQGAFLLPLLVALALKRELRWRYFLVPPAIMFLALIPAWAAGRSLVDLLMIYPAQAGQYEQLSMHAPSLLSWIPDTGRFYPYFYPIGLLAALVAALCYVLLVYRSRTKLSSSLLVELATISVMVVPFLLPKMHERYFYPADVFTILLAFYRPRLFYVPIGMSIISFFAYQPTIFDAQPVPIAALALGVLVLLMILTRDALLELYPCAVNAPDAVE